MARIHGVESRYMRHVGTNRETSGEVYLNIGRLQGMDGAIGHCHLDGVRVWLVELWTLGISACRTDWEWMNWAMVDVAIGRHLSINGFGRVC